MISNGCERPNCKSLGEKISCCCRDNFFVYEAMLYRILTIRMRAILSFLYDTMKFIPLLLLKNVSTFTMINFGFREQTHSLTCVTARLVGNEFGTSNSAPSGGRSCNWRARRSKDIHIQGNCHPRTSLFES